MSSANGSFGGARKAKKSKKHDPAWLAREQDRLFIESYVRLKQLQVEQKRLQAEQAQKAEEKAQKKAAKKARQKAKKLAKKLEEQEAKEKEEEAERLRLYEEAPLRKYVDARRVAAAIRKEMIREWTETRLAMFERDDSFVHMELRARTEYYYFVLRKGVEGASQARRLAIDTKCYVHYEHQRRLIAIYQDVYNRLTTDLHEIADADSRYFFFDIFQRSLHFAEGMSWRTRRQLRMRNLARNSMSGPLVPRPPPIRRPSFNVPQEMEDSFQYYERNLLTLEGHVHQQEHSVYRHEVLQQQVEVARIDQYLVNPQNEPPHDQQDREEPAHRLARQRVRQINWSHWAY